MKLRSLIVIAATLLSVTVTGTGSVASPVVIIPTNTVMDVFLTHVGPSREVACVLRVKAASTEPSTSEWRLFRQNKGDNNAALTFCMSRLLGDCVSTYGSETTTIAVNSFLVEAQDIFSYEPQDSSVCE